MSGFRAIQRVVPAGHQTLASSFCIFEQPSKTRNIPTDLAAEPTRTQESNSHDPSHVDRTTFLQAGLTTCAAVREQQAAVDCWREGCQLIPSAIEECEEDAERAREHDEEGNAQVIVQILEELAKLEKQLAVIRGNLEEAQARLHGALALQDEAEERFYQIFDCSSKDPSIGVHGTRDFHYCLGQNILHRTSTARLWGQLRGVTTQRDILAHAVDTTIVQLAPDEQFDATDPSRVELLEMQLATCTGALTAVHELHNTVNDRLRSAEEERVDNHRRLCSLTLPLIEVEHDAASSDKGNDGLSHDLNNGSNNGDQETPLQPDIVPKQDPPDEDDWIPEAPGPGRFELDRLRYQRRDQRRVLGEARDLLRDLEHIYEDDLFKYLDVGDGTQSQSVFDRAHLKSKFARATAITRAEEAYHEAKLDARDAGIVASTEDSLVFADRSDNGYADSEIERYVDTLDRSAVERWRLES